MTTRVTDLPLSLAPPVDAGPAGVEKAGVATVGIGILGVRPAGVSARVGAAKPAGVAVPPTARNATGADAHAAGDPAVPAGSDEALLSRLATGDAGAGEMLVLRYHGPLMRYLRRLGGQTAVAEELHQQTWLSVLEHAGRFDPRAGGFKPWLFRIATNKANDLWRRRRRERSVGDAADAADTADDASRSAEAAEEAARLREAIDRLPEAQKQVLLMRYYGGLKFIEIAAAVGCPLNTALGRMHKAVGRLRAMLGDDETPPEKPGDERPAGPRGANDA